MGWYLDWRYPSFINAMRSAKRGVSSRLWVTNTIVLLSIPCDLKNSSRIVLLEDQGLKKVRPKPNIRFYWLRSCHSSTCCLDCTPWLGQVAGQSKWLSSMYSYIETEGNISGVKNVGIIPYVLCQSPPYRNQGQWNIEWAIVEIWRWYHSGCEVEETIARQFIRDVCLWQRSGTWPGIRDQGPSVQDRRDNVFVEMLWRNGK